MNENSSGREEIGDVRERDGNTFVFIKGSQYTKVTNFTMRIDHHGTMEDRSEAFILSCQKQDNSIFTVPLHMSDLDSFNHLYSKILKFRPSDSQIMRDIGQRGKIHCYIDSLIKKYLNQDAKAAMYLIQRTGFHNIGDLGDTLYVVGPEQIIPASPNMANVFQETQMLWIGSKGTLNSKVGPCLSIGQIVHILGQMKDYHKDNMGSFLMLLAYYKISTHRHQLLQQCGINMPSLHIIGDISTGKSHLGEHFRCLMPYIENSNGTAHLKRDDSPTETVVNDELNMEGPPLLYDPALNLSSTAMNKLSDNIYQGVLHRTKHTIGGNQKVARGLVQIHAHENASLPGLLPTALTKSVLSVHHRQVSPDLEEMEEIHQSFVKNFEQHSGFFHVIVLPLDTEAITNDKNNFALKMTEELNGQYKMEVLKTSGRAMDNYALIMAGLKDLFKTMDLPQHLCDTYEKELYSFIVTRCIPRTIDALLSADPKIGLIGGAFPKEAMIKEICLALNALSWREFFQTVSMTRNSLHIAKDLFSKSKGMKLRDSVSLMENSFTLTRCHFLSRDSEVDWFKRSTNKLDSRGSHCIYGDSSKKLGFVIPFPKVWPSVHELVLGKCVEVLPTIATTSSLKEAYIQMCNHFDSENVEIFADAFENDGEGRLLEQFSSLSISKQKIFLRKATELHKQRVKDGKKQEIQGAADADFPVPNNEDLDYLMLCEGSKKPDSVHEEEQLENNCPPVTIPENPIEPAIHKQDKTEQAKPSKTRKMVPKKRKNCEAGFDSNVPRALRSKKKD